MIPSSPKLLNGPGRQFDSGQKFDGWKILLLQPSSEKLGLKKNESRVRNEFNAGGDIVRLLSASY